MKPRLNQTNIVLLILVLSGAVFFASSLYITAKQNEYAEMSRSLIEEQKETLSRAAELISRDGADDVVSDLIKDCSIEDRERFDLLLGKLSSLQSGELREIQQLFDTCGGFFALRTAVMVARFQREYEVYRDLISLLMLADKKADGITYTVEEWGELVDLQTQRSKLSTRLVALQGEIIESLIAGESIATDELQSKVVEGQQTREQLIELSRQTESLSQELLSL